MFAVWKKRRFLSNAQDVAFRHLQRPNYFRVEFFIIKQTRKCAVFVPQVPQAWIYMNSFTFWTWLYYRYKKLILLSKENKCFSFFDALWSGVLGFFEWQNWNNVNCKIYLLCVCFLCVVTMADEVRQHITLKKHATYFSFQDILPNVLIEIKYH